MAGAEKTEHKPDFGLIEDTTYHLMGKLWDAYWKLSRENWKCYIGTALFIAIHVIVFQQTMDGKLYEAEVGDIN